MGLVLGKKCIFSSLYLRPNFCLFVNAFFIVTFHFLYDFLAELKIFFFFVVVMRNECVFHVLSSIGMRDFITLQVLVFAISFFLFVCFCLNRYLTLMK